jgi:tetratricopeptide (TPR) repeat protein
LNDDVTVPFVGEHSATAWTLGGLIADRYRIDGQLGKGGMGVVHSAVDITTGARVALKVLVHDSPSALVRFKREFHAARRLAHPNCVQVYTLGQHHGRWFFAMEYIEGGHLDGRTCSTSVDVAKVFAQTLAALDHVHARQIVHRDIKPQNILVERGSLRVKLSDLGIAQVDDAESAFTVGQLMGSARYLSPEQARSESVDPRGDLYSLGIVIYELLTGHTPYAPGERTFEAWLETHRTEMPRWPMDRSLPRELVEIVMRLLAKDPRDRFPTAAATYDAVAAWLGRFTDGATFLERMPPLERKGYVAAPEFIGRLGDLQALDEFVRAVISGHDDAPLILRVEGDAGVGKSRLVSRALPTFVNRRSAIIVGTCPPQGGAPYEPIRALLQLNRDVEPMRAPTSESEAPTRSDLAKSSRDAAPRDSGQMAVPDEGFDERAGQVWRLYRGVVDAILERSRLKPFIVFVEDIQWADPASIDLLGFVIRALAQARAQGTVTRAGIIVTHRREVPPEVQQMIDAAAELRVERAIDLRPFGADEAGDLVSAMLSVPRDAAVDRFTDRLLAHGEGTPLFIGQALKLLVGSGQLARTAAGWNLDEVGTQAIKLPTSVREAIGDRAGRLKVGTQRALGVASVRGRRFTLSEILPIVEIPEPELLDDIDEAVREGFIVEEADEGHYAFAHDRIRESIYDRLPRDDAQSLHRAIARLMYERNPRSSDLAAEIAHHAWEGGDTRRAYIEYWRAGDHAMKRYAFARAAELYGHALVAADASGRAPRSALLERHGDACLQAGRYQAARESYDRRLGSATSDLERAELLRRQADVEHRSGNTTLAGTLLEEVLRALGFRIPRTRFGLVVGILRSVLASLFVLMLPLLRRKKPRQDRRRQIISRTCSTLAVHYFWSDFIRAAFFQFSGMSVAEKLGPSPELTVALAQQGLGVAVYGFYGTGQSYVDRARECGEIAATPLEQGWQELMRGMSHGCAGRVSDHIAAEVRAEQLLLQCPETLLLRQVWTIAGEAYLEAGRIADAENVATKLLQMAHDVSDTRGLGWGTYLIGHALLWRGHVDAARGKLEEAVTLSAKSGDLTYQLAATGRLISARMQTGDTAGALALGVEAAKRLTQARLRNPTIVVDGVMLGAAALARQAGAVPDDALVTIRKTARWRGLAARNLRYTTPWFYVGKGAWYRACGSTRRGEGMIARGLKLAERRQLMGEQYELHRYLARFYAASPERAAQHVRVAEELRARAAH